MHKLPEDVVINVQVQRHLENELLVESKRSKEVRVAVPKKEKDRVTRAIAHGVSLDDLKQMLVLREAEEKLNNSKVSENNDSESMIGQKG